MQDYRVSLLKNMLEKYSPSGSEAGLSRFLQEEMKANALRARVDDVGNVIGEVGLDGPRVLLCGHMDTVPGLLPVYEDDGLIHGRGAVDAKASLAAMILGCVKAARKSVAPFHATVVGVVEEETSSKGMTSIVSSGTRYDMAVFGEPSSTSGIIIGYKGRLKLWIRCQSHGGHSSSPWLSRNSLEDAFGFWNLLRSSLLENDSSSRFYTITGSLVNAKSEPGGNSIPTKSILEVDLRIPPGTMLSDIIGKIDRLKADYIAKNGGIHITLDFSDETRPFLGKNDSLAVRAFRYAIRRITSNEVTLVKKTGTSDMNILAGVCEAPMVAYGPGDSSLDHTDLERVNLNDYFQSIDVYAAAIERFAILASRQPLTINA